MVALSHDLMGAPRCHPRRWPVASHQRRKEHAAPAKLPQEAAAAKARTLPDSEAALILTPMYQLPGTPPHRPVLALLTHTVPTSDFGVETHPWVRLQDLDCR